MGWRGDQGKGVTAVCMHAVCDTDQFITRDTEGMWSRLSGSRLISFMMLARRTGSSLRKNWNDISCDPDLEPAQCSQFN